MPGRDVISIERDMDKFIVQAKGMLKRNELEPDTDSVIILAMAMFDDYRDNSPRGVAELEAEKAEELMRLERKLFGKKGRKRR